jgi:putative sulfotransferase
MSAKPFFIVSSGRSGTAMLQKSLDAVPGVDMHHEYMVQITQPLGVKRYLGMVGEEETRRILADTHGAAIHYSKASHWGDSSNKLSWLISDLAALFPDARFVHLVRDGRKVSSSYFHKLGAECYDDEASAILQAHADDFRVPAPPPEKRYWWPCPRHGSSDAAAFRRYSQFQRIAWHWAEINRVTLAALDDLPPERSLFVRLEDLVGSPNSVRGLYDFLGLAYTDAAFAAFARPHNVNRPEDRLLSPDQAQAFEAIAGGMMARLGYAERPEYLVNY